ncbi:DoxX family membrane protein [Haladaptatus pallidirubidus]|uniref:DoxX family protein n=1 Tax=Haladaptatus pallidirubidus TaxID=1008152 RepID=A0AAV3UGS1_9EURY|nr:DoxX family membrane protein [Haladaptatus pallidirubidus]
MKLLRTESTIEPSSESAATGNASGNPYVVVPFLLLLVVLLVLRGLGVLGVTAVDSWPIATRLALAVMFVFTSLSHFAGTRDTLIRMVPDAVPHPGLLVTITGLAEIAGAIGLLLSGFAPAAGLGLTVLLVVMFPANVVAARKNIEINGKPATPLWFRVLIQLFFIALLLWATGWM